MNHKDTSANLYSGDGMGSIYTYIYNTLLPRHSLHFRDGGYKLLSDNSYQAVKSDFTKITIPVNV